MQALDLDKAKLLQYVERIEAYEDTITDANASKKAIMEDAKADGFNPKAIKYIIRQRKKDRDQIAEEKELFDAYSKAVGL